MGGLMLDYRAQIGKRPGRGATSDQKATANDGGRTFLSLRYEVQR